MEISKRITAALLCCSILLAGCGKSAVSSSETAVPTKPDVATEAATETTTVTEAAEETTTAGKTTVKTTSGTTTTVSGSQTAYIISAATTRPSQSRVTTRAQNYTTTAVTTTTVTTTTVTTAALPPADRTPEEQLSVMSLRQKVGQMFMITPEQFTNVYPMTAVGSVTENMMMNYPVGGVIYLAPNIVSDSQIKKMISDTQAYAKKSSNGVGIFTALDEEGGSITRVRQKLNKTPTSDMAVYGARNNYNEAYNVGKTIGSYLKPLGFNVDLAPVADVNIDSRNELGTRIFSSDANVVSNMVAAVSKGLKDTGVCATLKHFPGLGAESGNTHNDSFVVIDRSLEQLRGTEFVAFKGGIDAGADLVMVGHQITTGFGDNLPADLSYVAITEMLRGELGFDGVVITDSQQMNTILNVYTSGQAAKMSVKAGADIILAPKSITEAIDAVCAAVESGEIPESRIDESALRILRLKKELGLF